MAFALAFIALGAFVAWMVIAGARHQHHHRHWPRGYIETVVGFAYSLGWWPWRDQFGLHRDPVFLPPPPEPTTVIRVEEVMREEQQGEVEQKTKVQEILGG